MTPLPSHFNRPPLTAHLLLHYLSISGEGETFRIKSVRTGACLRRYCHTFSLLSSVLTSSVPLFEACGRHLLCGKRAESSSSQVAWVASGSQGGIRGGLTIVIAERWGWAASCSAKCCAVSGTLSGRPASPPPPQGWSPLYNKYKHISYIAGFICLFMDKAGNVPYWKCKKKLIQLSVIIMQQF